MVLWEFVQNISTLFVIIMQITISVCIGPGIFVFFCTEELIHKSFSAYGCIQEIRVFKEKGYAFIRSASLSEICQCCRRIL